MNCEYISHGKALIYAFVRRLWIAPDHFPRCRLVHVSTLMDADTVGFARATRACIEIAPS